MLHSIEHYPESYLDTIAEIFENKSSKKEELKVLKELSPNNDNEIKIAVLETEIKASEENKQKLKKQLKKIIRKPYEERIKRKDTLAKLTEDILREYMGGI